MAALLAAAGALGSGGKGSGSFLVYIQDEDKSIPVELPMDATVAQLFAASGLSEGSELTFQGERIPPEPADAMLADLGLSNEVTLMATRRSAMFKWDIAHSDGGHRPDLFELDETECKATKVKDDSLTYGIRAKPVVPLKNPNYFDFRVRIDSIPNDKYNGGYSAVSLGGSQRNYDGIGVSLASGGYMCEHGVRIRMGDGEIMQGYSTKGKLEPVNEGDIITVHCRLSDNGSGSITFFHLDKSFEVEVELDVSSGPVRPCFQIEKIGFAVTLV
eukprot:Hpha_TRINITY_DN15644_c1_g7::TRINITY_DN15644_c1_g7_i1::g.97602::m.97602